MAPLITVNGNTIDASSSQFTGPNTQNSKFIFLVGKHILTNGEKRTLSDNKVQIQEYIFDSTYKCKLTGDLNVVRQLAFVLLANVWPSELKATKALKTRMAESKDSNARYEIDIIFHAKSTLTPKELSEGPLATASQVKKESMQLAPNKVRLTVDRAVLPAIEKLDDINRIEEVIPQEPANNIARQYLNIDTIQGGALKSTRFQGEGQLIVVADSGIDKQHLAFGNKQIERIVRVHDEWNLQVSGGKGNPYGADSSGHGTHVSASVAGDGVTEVDKVKIAIKGAAPNAKLCVQSLEFCYKPNGGPDIDWLDIICPNDIGRLFDDPIQTWKAKFHSNSWTDRFAFGSPQPDYDDKASRIDEYAAWYQDFVVVFAAGNNGSLINHNNKREQIGAASGAKNCITVGATGSSRTNDNDGKKYVPRGGTVGKETGPESVPQFSSRGPTTNGRIKPDVVAPGCTILSAASHDMESTRVYDPVDKQEKTLRAKKDAEHGSWPDKQWRFESGTSMATPLVTGSLAILREALISSGYPTPSAPLLKALLINGTTDLSTLPNADPTIPKAPNGIQGFGRVDVAKSLLMADTSQKVPGAGFVDSELRNRDTDIRGSGGARPLGVGESWKSGPIPVKGSTFKATLVYFDQPGALLQNDLNLIVRTGDRSERHGNMGTAEGFDNVNNVEKVVWEKVPQGDVTIEIKAAGTLDPDAAQAFAVAWISDK
ncbi:MAG: hypothetical protein M1831_004464 [Alyxoria varia]|nr:MAG: hypothetical protein M1831_004464 [Alyxoria varia]